MTVLTAKGEGAEFVQTASPALRETLAYARKVAVTPYPVLLTGETGTGKELMARAIHAASGCPGAFAAVNCAAIPEQLFEAELFGAERGAYTGLESARPGLFRAADRGTLFLDEIAEMPLAAQAKLLRVLQDGEVRPLGATTSHRVDVRIIAATHQDLPRAITEGRFRQDLYFRISTARIALPSLRDRHEDIPMLLHHALAEAARVQRLPAPEVTESAIAFARSYAWPGNVRELMHVVAVAVLHAGTRPLTREDFAELVRGTGAAIVPNATADHELSLGEATEIFERRYLLALMSSADGNLTRAARVAGVARSTLREKLRRCGIVTGSTPVTGWPPTASGCD